MDTFYILEGLVALLKYLSWDSVIVIYQIDFNEGET